jgi:hypothetical protein
MHENTESLANLFTNWMVYFKLFNLSKLNNLPGNQFTLASLYFTLAFTGTVAFSIANIYAKHKNDLEKKHLEWVGEYKEWFEEYEHCINFSILDYRKIDKVNEFNSVISNLYEKLNFGSVDELRNFTKYYEDVRKLIAESFLAGIGTLIISSDCSNCLLFALGVFLYLVFSLAISLYLVFVNIKPNGEKNYENQQAILKDLKTQIQALYDQLHTKDEQIEKLNENMHKQEVHIQTLIQENSRLNIKLYPENTGGGKPWWKFW